MFSGIKDSPLLPVLLDSKNKGWTYGCTKTGELGPLECALSTLTAMVLWCAVILCCCFYIVAVKLHFNYFTIMFYSYVIYILISLGFRRQDEKFLNNKIN